MEHWLEREIAQWVHHEGSIRRPIVPWANALTMELHLTPSCSEWTTWLNSSSVFSSYPVFSEVIFHLEGAGRSSEVEHSHMVRWVVGSILHGVDPLSYFSFQPVLHDWCNKGRGMYYPVCGMVHIKEPLLLRQRVSFLTIRMVLNHMSDAI